MQTVGIAIDNWKLPVFKRCLTDAGFGFDQHPGVVRGTLLLKVKTDYLPRLQLIVEKANAECALMRSKPFSGAVH